MNNFENVNLTLTEKYKLFIMRFIKHANDKFLGKDSEYLLKIEFIEPDLAASNSELIPYTFAGTYHLTQKYKRYCIHCRKIFVRGMFSSFITPIVVSIITSILTVLVLRLLGLQ